MSRTCSSHVRPVAVVVGRPVRRRRLEGRDDAAAGKVRPGTRAVSTPVSRTPTATPAPWNRHGERSLAQRARGTWTSPGVDGDVGGSALSAVTPRTRLLRRAASNEASERNVATNAPSRS